MSIIFTYSSGVLRASQALCAANGKTRRLRGGIGAAFLIVLAFDARAQAVPSPPVGIAVPAPEQDSARAGAPPRGNDLATLLGPQANTAVSPCETEPKVPKGPRVTHRPPVEARLDAFSFHPLTDF
jgi:hypothetical protein